MRGLGWRWRHCRGREWAAVSEKWICRKKQSNGIGTFCIVRHAMCGIHHHRQIQLIVTLGICACVVCSRVQMGTSYAYHPTKNYSVFSLKAPRKKNFSSSFIYCSNFVTDLSLIFHLIGVFFHSSDFYGSLSLFRSQPAWNIFAISPQVCRCVVALCLKTYTQSNAPTHTIQMLCCRSFSVHVYGCVCVVCVVFVLCSV